MFGLMDVNENMWGFIMFYAAKDFTEYSVPLGPVFYVWQTETVFFPLQWTSVCLSLDSSADKLTLVVDGEMLGEGEYRREEDKDRPASLSLLLGFDPANVIEFTGKIANFNVFSTALSVEDMVGLTQAGGGGCGAGGDLVSWEEAEWTLLSKAKVIEVGAKWEAPCRRESQVQVFTADFEYHQDCMQHCTKISGGRSPPVITEEEWTNLTMEIDLITKERALFGVMWLSATEGDKNQELARGDDWPETEVVKNVTQMLKAVETVWRDFYTGQQLDNWPKPYFNKRGDTLAGDTANCMEVFVKEPWRMTWGEWQCHAPDRTCSCSYPAQPLLRLRGLCKKSLIEKLSKEKLFTPKQLPGNPRNLILLGQSTARIEYNDASSQWVLTDTKSDVTAVSRATQLS